MPLILRLYFNSIDFVVSLFNIVFEVVSSGKRVLKFIFVNIKTLPIIIKIASKYFFILLLLFLVSFLLLVSLVTVLEVSTVISALIFFSCAIGSVFDILESFFSLI